ncbi:iron ABC transporter permease [Gammaproteobacteria bacterium]|nr:iron ABC transporter permease [Gammaproteobacteria bacterium]
MTSKTAYGRSRSAPHAGRLSRWWLPLLALGLCLVIAPFATVLWLAINPLENIWPHLSRTVLPHYVGNTVLLAAGVGTGTVIVGFGSAWLVATRQFPGRRVLRVALFLPMAMPAYVVAFAYTDLLEYAGPVQSMLRELFDWNNRQSYWFPPIRSLGGAIFVLTAVLYPYVYLFSLQALTEISPSLIHVSRTLPGARRKLLTGVVLPITRPAVITGLALVLMETVNDYGTVSFFAVHTLTTGIYDVWLQMGNIGGAAQIALVTLGLIVLLLWLEWWGRRKRRYYQSARSHHADGDSLLDRPAGWGTTAICALPVLVGFFVPALPLLMHTLQRGIPLSLLPVIGNSIVVGVGAALLVLLLAINAAIVARYGQALDRDNWAWRLTRPLRFGYALPGTVLGLGVLAAFTSIDHLINDVAEWFGLEGPGLVLSASIMAIIAACAIRFLTIGIGAVENSLARVPRSIDYAYLSMGYSPERGLRRFVLPLLRRGYMTGLLLVFVESIKELPATLALRPIGFDTLATEVYQFASDERLSQAAPGSLLIALIGLVPVLLLHRSQQVTARLYTQPTKASPNAA